MTALLTLLVLGQVYVWTDARGEQHFTDDLGAVPKGVTVRTSDGDEISVVPATGSARKLPASKAGTGEPSAKPADDAELHPTLELKPLPSSLKPGDDAVLREAVVRALRLERLAAMGGLRRTVFLEVLDSMDEVRRRGAPEWAGGFTTGPTQVYLLSPAIGTLTGGRPRDWDEMTAHELAHAQLWQWAGGQQPRWFKEGYAMWVASQAPHASTEDIAWWAVRHGGPRPLSAAWNAPHPTTAPIGERVQVIDSYGVSCEGLRFFVERFGAGALRAVVTGMQEGARFADAFRAASGQSEEAFEQAFLEHLRPAFHERAE
jgi:hypothetical protein